jgi:hypothetical protein
MVSGSRAATTGKLSAVRSGTCNELAAFKNFHFKHNFGIRDAHADSFYQAHLAGRNWEPDQ